MFPACVSPRQSPRLAVALVALTAVGAVCSGGAPLSTRPAALTTTQRTADVRLPNVPIGFEPNRGQAAAGVRYVARAGGGTLLLTDDGALLRLAGALG